MVEACLVVFLRTLQKKGWVCFAYHVGKNIAVRKFKVGVSCMGLDERE